MAAKAEISWKTRNADGERREVYAQHVGNRWMFYHRPGRFQNWELLENPPIEDWTELLDAIRRRIQRRLQRPEEEQRILKAMAERFPPEEVARVISELE